MYLIGLLFGLGFDTATEISLLVLAGGAAVVTIPWYAILTLPVLFAAGMCALDTLDGVLMTFTYGWALASPGRKLYYNITITALSVAIAFIIGGQEIVAVVASKLDVTDGPIGWISAVDLDYAGFVIIGLFIACWAVAIAIWHFGKLNVRSKEVSSG
jgi:high-affinity nickel-transport protein